MTKSARQHRVRFGLFAGAAMLVATIGARAELGQVKNEQTPALPEEELARTGEALVNKICDTTCHGLEKLDETRRTRREWSDSVDAMATRGAIATAAQFSTIKKYLTRYYGVVAVNTAPADELAAVLGLSTKDAAAIVDYRTAHGRFADLTALLKVPGLDKAKVEEQEDALRFN